MGEKILDKLKEIWGKIADWWNRFTSKQKTLIVVAACAVVLAFVGLYALLSAPNYTILETADSTKEASEIVNLLEENDIPYKVTDDGLQIKVPQDMLSVARLSLGAAGIKTSTYDLDTALSGGFTVTESDKQRKYELYIESTMESDFLVYFDNIKSAKVDIHLADDDGTLFSSKEEPTATIALQTEGDFDSDNAAFIAQAVATALGKSNTEGITILDMQANLLFSGNDDASVSGHASSQLGVKSEAETLMNGKVRNVLSGTGQFGEVKVATNLDIDFSTTQQTTHNYDPADGQSQGLLSEEKNYTADNQGGNGGPPGTDSNGETTYQYQDNEYSSSTIEEYYKKYLPNEYIEYKEIPAGTINYGGSSVAVSSVLYNVIKEEDAKEQGLLDGITWAEYQLANSEKTQLPVSDDMITLVANATGISTSNINIVAYSENVFVDSEGLGLDVTKLVQIVLIVLILLLLAIVVIRSMRTEKEEEETEEISVENLLQSNPEPQLESIEGEESSETKRMIEKFVDENPEAVANLLRNWLNEEWG